MDKQMKYIKPKCDCGRILKVSRSEVWSVTRSITDDGEFGNVVNLHTNYDDCEYEFELHCIKCGNKYEGDYDDLDRIIRGMKKN